MISKKQLYDVWMQSYKKSQNYDLFKYVISNSGHQNCPGDMKRDIKNIIKLLSPLISLTYSLHTSKNFLDSNPCMLENILKEL
jgi:hypothetical protein